MYSDLREYNMTAYSDCCKGEGYRSYSVYILKVKTLDWLRDWMRMAE